jgi:hypothetical protein
LAEWFQVTHVPERCGKSRARVPRVSDRVFRKVDAGHFVAPRGEVIAVEAGAAAEVDDPRALPKAHGPGQEVADGGDGFGPEAGRVGVGREVRLEHPGRDVWVCPEGRALLVGQRTRKKRDDGWNGKHGDLLSFFGVLEGRARIPPVKKKDAAREKKRT